MKLVLFISLSIVLTSCWPSSVSLVDSGSMPPEWKTFTVKTLDLEAPNAPNNLASVLTEEIKDGIQNNTRLLINPKQGAGEISIEGVVTNYSADPIAIQQGDEAAKNRLSMSVNFTIYISKPKEDKMTLTSTQFIDFDPITTDFSSNEVSLYEEINKKIVQDVINKLLSNW
jgi:hypothetical protein